MSSKTHNPYGHEWFHCQNLSRNKLKKKKKILTTFSVTYSNRQKQQSRKRRSKFTTHNRRVNTSWPQCFTILCTWFSAIRHTTESNKFWSHPGDLPAIQQSLFSNYVCYSQSAMDSQPCWSFVGNSVFPLLPLIASPRKLVYETLTVLKAMH